MTDHDATRGIIPVNPQLVIIAGPNGAGKSSWAPALLRDTVGLPTFLNADVIAQGLSGFRPQDAAVAAGRVLLNRFDELAAAQTSFALESTLSGQTLARRCAALRTQGYEVHVLYLWLATPELAAARIVRRVRLGGHDVPPSDVYRRYARSFRMFYHSYRPLTTTWRVYDASDIDELPLVARGRGAAVPEIVDAERWTTMLTTLGLRLS
jgi:predicted ABC-type ATPase